MKPRILLLTLLSAVLLFAQTQPQPAPGAGGPAPGIAALKNALDLTDQQIQQLTQLRREEAAVLQPIRQQIQEKSQALKEALASPNPDRTLVGSLTVEIRNLRQQVQETNKLYHEKALAVLTPDQKTKLDQLANVSRRAALAGPALRAATLLNLILPPPGVPRPGAQTPAAPSAPTRRMGPQR